jgi:hypothetical protein
MAEPSISRIFWAVHSALPAAAAVEAPTPRQKDHLREQKTYIHLFNLVFFWLFHFILVLGQSSSFGHTVADINVISSLLLFALLQFSFLESHVILYCCRK